MTLEENKSLIRRYFEEARHDPDICDQIFQPHFTFRTIQHATVNAEIESTPQSEKEAYAWLQATWGDWRLTVDEMIAEDDRVMVRWTFTGTHQGEYFGLPATGRPVQYSGINIFRLADGKIAEIADLYDRLWLWQQLGVLPESKVFISEAKEKMK